MRIFNDLDVVRPVLFSYMRRRNVTIFIFVSTQSFFISIYLTQLYKLEPPPPSKI